MNIKVIPSNVKGDDKYRVVNDCAYEDEVRNLIYVARNKDTLSTNDSRYIAAAKYVVDFLMNHKQFYMILECGPDFTTDDRDRIMKGMKDLYEKEKLLTLSVWLSKDSCPYLSIMIPQSRCNICFAKDNLKFCSQCKTITYCSAECQKKDWPKHKTYCVKK